MKRGVALIAALLMGLMLVVGCSRDKEPAEARINLRVDSLPPDAFAAQRPCFRATSLLLSRKGSHKIEGG